MSGTSVGILAGGSVVDQVLEAGGYNKVFIPAVGKSIKIIFKGSDPIESEEEILNKVKSMLKQEKGLSAFEKDIEGISEIELNNLKFSPSDLQAMR